MRETDYTYAVARIRANELNLLTSEDIKQLISAASTDVSLRILTDKGRSGNDETELCENEMSKAFSLICESVPDNSLTDALAVGNDFFNLKAAIKTVFSGLESESYMTSPCLTDSGKIIEAVKTNNFTLLPDYLAECGEKAYKAISECQSGQKAEIIIDKYCLDTKAEFAEKSSSEVLVKIARLSCVISNIKTALRSAKTGKTKEFALEALSVGCKSLDNEKLVDAAFSGEKLEDIIAEAGYTDIAKYADGDFSILEKQGDNLITSYIRKAKYEIFGPDPIVAYYYAKIAETKNVRIILSAKASSVPEETITERVRELYV